MSRILAVKVERLDRTFTPLVAAKRDIRGACRLTTLSPDQETAEIEVYLLDYRRGASSPRSTRRVHRFRVSHTRGSDGQRPVFVLEAKRLRRRIFELRLSRDGRPIDAATVRVPPSRRAALAVPLLLLLAAATAAIVGRCTGGDQSQPAPVAVGNTRNGDRPVDPPRPPAERPPAETPATGTTPQPRSASSPSEDSTPKGNENAPVAETIVRETVRETVYFLPDSVALTSDGRRTLDSFRERLGTGEIITITIEGHTALYGNEAGREMISTGRIRSVVEYLDLPEDLSVERRAYGATRPVSRAAEEQQLNRRAEIIATYRRGE